MPKPVQPGGVPIWVSGTVNRRVVRRLAEHGSGWIPWGPAAADVRRGIAEMREAVAAVGRDPSDIQVLGSLPLVAGGDERLDLEATMAAVPSLALAGVTDFRVRLPSIPSDEHEAERELAAVVAAFRAAAAVSTPAQSPAAS